ncbi:MAG: GspH/FimT family pseudopilin [Betaproteobacteria bacterium]|nr:GspH/FimT family pseudopilin [Betaproteobacteria bacterium]
MTIRVAPPPRLSQGFTLVELAVALVVLGILVAIGLPSFTELVASQRARAAASALYDSLVLARSEAIKRNTSTTLSVTNGNLASGWSVTAGTVTLRQQEAFSNLTFNPAAPSIAYNFYGRLTSGAGNIQITSSGSVKCWMVTVDVSGRASVSNYSQGCP